MPEPRERRLPSPTAESLLLAWLLVALQPMNRTRVKQLLQHGQIHVNGVAVTRHDHPIGPADRIAISTAAAVRTPVIDLTIVHEDESVIAIDKPSGLLTVSTEAEKQDTAFSRLSAHLQAKDAGRPYVVHRLDRDTSGLLLFARSPAMRDALQKNWDEVKKTYLAIVEGVPEPAEGTIENHLLEGNSLRVRIVKPGGEAKLAITRYRTLSTYGRNSLVEVNLVTGRKHQIRVHLASLGCPVIGDTGYGAKTNSARRLGLHAWKLALPHPRTQSELEFESRFPEELNRIVRLER